MTIGTRVLILLPFAAICFCNQSADGAEVVIDPAQKFQTINGWGHGGGVLGGTGGAASMLPAALADPFNYQYLAYLTEDLGLTGSRGGK
jgi:hypothetical protein